jgi:hypothetical protein
MGWHVRESRIGFLARTEPADRVADLRATPPALPPTIAASASTAPASTAPASTAPASTAPASSTT